VSGWDLFLLAGGSLYKHGRRTVLSLLGVAIGVAAVLVLTALGEGARRYVLEQFQSIGSNLVVVLPGKVDTTGAVPGMMTGVPNDMTIADAEAVRRALPSARAVGPVAMGNDTVSFEERSRQVAIAGTTAEIVDIWDLELRAGRFLPSGPWHRGGTVAVLGATVAEELFPGVNPLGKTVRIGSWRMRVTGVMAPRGVQLAFDMDEMVFVPTATVMRMFNRTSLFRIMCKMPAGADLDLAQLHVIDTIVARHGEEDVTVVTQDAVMSSLSAILGVLTAVLAGIAAISLSVAGIGIMNVMLVSVAERTREIGLLKALGAAPRQILSLFLTEATLLSLSGGLAGLALGTVLTRLLVLVYPNFPASPPWWAVVSAAGVSIVVGVSFGLLPARHAMRLDPVRALTEGRG